MTEQQIPDEPHPEPDTYEPMPDDAPGDEDDGDDWTQED